MNKTPPPGSCIAAGFPQLAPIGSGPWCGAVWTSTDGMGHVCIREPNHAPHNHKCACLAQVQHVSSTVTVHKPGGRGEGVRG